MIKVRRRPRGAAARLRRDEGRHLAIDRASAEVLCHCGLRSPARVKVAVGLEGRDELHVLRRGAILPSSRGTMGRGEYMCMHMHVHMHMCSACCMCMCMLHERVHVRAHVRAQVRAACSLAR